MHFVFRILSLFTEPACTVLFYVLAPGTPTIDVTRCARSESTVALFLVPPRGSDVIDTYVIRYCSEEQKSLGIEVNVKVGMNDRKNGRLLA